MWIGFYCLPLMAVIVTDGASIDSSLDPKNIVDNGYIFESRLQMGNIIDSLSESHKALTKALLEMIERQEKYETKLSELEENRKYFSNSKERQEKLETNRLKLREMSETSFLILEKRQDKLESKLLEFMEKSEKHFSSSEERQEKLETQFIEKSEKPFLNLEKRQEKLETKLSEFMEKTEKYFSNSVERQFSSTVESDEFDESTKNNWMTMKNGQIPGNSNGNHNLDKNVEWTTIARRKDGSVSFYRNWTEYENGFGYPDGEFFIGLEKLHNLTTQGAPQELLIVMINEKNEESIAKYGNFKIGNAKEKYELLELGEYRGNAGDYLRGNKNKKFTTYDNDNKNRFSNRANCADMYGGGWWYDLCLRSLFAGYDYGLRWGPLTVIRFVEMKIRPKL